MLLVQYESVKNFKWIAQRKLHLLRTLFKEHCYEKPSFKSC